jgi:hypothetical protein
MLNSPATDFAAPPRPFWIQDHAEIARYVPSSPDFLPENPRAGMNASATLKNNEERKQLQGS